MGQARPVGRAGQSVRVLGIDVLKNPDPVKQRIGIQLQTTALFQKLTVREIIRDSTKTPADLRNYIETAGADLGMHSFDQFLYKLHEAKKITLDTALANATNRADLERRLMMETGGRNA